ncbi:hypothetical protein U9M48_035322, partial [Paspalum notatum var. saurae]
MAGYPCSFSRFWMTEEKDDDIFHLADDDEAELATYNHLLQCESFESRQRSNAPPKGFRPRNLPEDDGHMRIWADYFAEHLVFNDRQFRQRFRMRRHMVLRIADAVEAQNPRYFKRKHDCCDEEGLFALQKCVAALRILAFGLPTHAIDEYVRIGASTARESLHHFCQAMIEVYSAYYLWAPNEADVNLLLAEGEERGFPGMLGSIDCMHWELLMCPTAWQGMFTGRWKHPSMILEAVASRDLWIWHVYFGMPGRNNNINVLQRSPVFSSYLRGQSTSVEFEVNGKVLLPQLPHPQASGCGRRRILLQLDELALTGRQQIHHRRMHPTRWPPTPPHPQPPRHPTPTQGADP